VLILSVLCVSTNAVNFMPKKTKQATANVYYHLRVVCFSILLCAHYTSKIWVQIAKGASNMFLVWPNESWVDYWKGLRELTNNDLDLRVSSNTSLWFQTVIFSFSATSVETDELQAENRTLSSDENMTPDKPFFKHDFHCRSSWITRETWTNYGSVCWCNLL